MKTTTILVLLLLFLGSPLIQGQDLLGGVLQVAEQHNEAEGEKKKKKNEGDNALTPQQEEWQQQWEAEWLAQQDAEIMKAMNTNYLKCTALMVLYVDMYLKLMNHHKIGDISMSACDAYGMQALAMASSTTIMYCPEKMAELSDEELKEIFSDFLNLIADHYDQTQMDGLIVDENNGTFVWENASGLGKKVIYILNSFIIAADDQIYDDTELDIIIRNLVSGFVKYLIEFFSPRYIIPQSLKIAQEMEAMGCSKPN